jgi:multiple sugar transport system permease protein
MIQEKSSSSNTLNAWKRRLWPQSIIAETGVFGYVLRLFALVATALFFILPLVWLLVAPTKLDSELITLSPLALGSLDNLKQAFSTLYKYFGDDFLKWTLNTGFYTLASIILALAFSLPAGFALAFGRFEGRKTIMWLTMILMIMPGAALVLPMFLEMNLLRLINTPWAVILPAAFYPFGVYLCYIFFASNIPVEVLDAARIDGCSELQLFWHIGLPLSRTLLGLLTFLLFTGLWNNYYWPSLVLSSPKYFNLPMGVQHISISTNAFRMGVPSNVPLHRPEGALLVLFLALPVAIIFVLSQRYVSSGAMTGAVKE